jgi:hypothetical protein
MDLEQILREFKETADRTFLRPLDDTADLENRIRAGIHKRSRRNVIRTITVASLAAAALMFVIVLPQPNSGGQNHITTAPAHDATPDDAAILQKVEEIKESLRIGLTQDEVLKRINGSPTIVDDNGDLESGADEFWNYSFFRQEGYAPKEPLYVVDEEGLRGRKTGANLFIGWKEKKLYFYSITYVQGEKNDIVFFLMRSNGTVSEETLGVQQAPSVFDLSPELKDLYFAYMKEKKDELLKGLTPIDIFKLYVHAEEEGDLHTQYALYIQDEEYEKPTLEQFLEDVKKDPAGAERSYKQIAELKEQANGFEVMMQDEKRAIVYVKFKDHREPLGFRVRKDKNNIWKVSWLPIQ